LKKQPFFANDFKIQGGPRPPLPPRSDAHPITITDSISQSQCWMPIQCTCKTMNRKILNHSIFIHNKSISKSCTSSPWQWHISDRSDSECVL